MPGRGLGGQALLLEACRNADTLTGLAPLQWELLLEQADSARLMGRLVFEADRLGISRHAPGWLADRLGSARAMAHDSERSIEWEINRLARAFLHRPVKWVLLKGAGYVAAGLPPARGRRVADLDVLVPFESLAAAEAALREHGWEPAALSEYDQRYYREWMHELPPLVHGTRNSVIDLHHTILPRTSRLHPDPNALLDRAVPAGQAHVLCPPHMIVHAAVHLFHDGEISGAVRDLVDLDALLRCFDGEPGFWEQLIADGEALGVTRPIFYALRYAERLLGTPIPAHLGAARDSWAPPSPLLKAMDTMVDATLGAGGGAARLSALALYARSHWLRMPPLMLARHLTRKALAR